MISIITVTLNHLDGLKRTAGSVLEQSCGDYEWVVIDGGSDDGSLDFLNTLPRVDIISEPDGGIYDAMNKGLERVCGQYTIFMNAGDVFYSAQTLKTIVELCTQEQPDFIYGNAIEQGRCKAARSHNQKEWGMFTHHQAMVYSRAMIGVSRYCERYRIAADYEFTLRVLERCPHVEYIAQPLCEFESGGVSQSHAWEGRIEQFKIRHDLKVCNIFENLCIFVAQTLAHTLRGNVPRLYWWLRSM